MGLINYVKATRSEMVHVNWPSRKDTVQYTILIIAISVGVSIVLGISDFVFSKLLTLLF
jgi:preprotein translocase subunit SecE